MKTNKLMLCVFGFMLLFTVAAASAADAPKLKFKFTKSNVPGAQQTEPDGINNAGVTVGQYEDTSGVFHGYILNGKKLTTLDDPNGSNTIAANLPYNGAMTVVGIYTNSAGADVGFLYKKGTFTDILGPPGAISSVADGINDKQEILGWYTDSSGVTHGFLLKRTKYTTLDVPGATFGTYGTEINDKGNIVLAWIDSNGFDHSALYNGKTYKNIDVPGATNSWVNGINNEGDLVFAWWDSSGLGHGAVLHGGKYYKYDYPKGFNTYGDGINDKRTVSGGYQAQTNGPWSGYLAAYK